MSEVSIQLPFALDLSQDPQNDSQCPPDYLPSALKPTDNPTFTRSR
jgi:hypothetical protein